jgi:hypothetical protein
MKKLEIQDRINVKIGAFLTPYDYKFNSKDSSFVKHYNWGFQNVFVSFANYLPYNIRVGSSINIRVNKVEAILQKFLKQEKKIFQNSLTYGGTLIGMAQGKSNIYIDVYNYEELDIAIDKVQEMIVNYGFNFLKTYSSLQALYFAFNECRDENLLYTPYNSYYGLIIAKLLNKPNINELVQFYAQYAKKFKPVMYLDIFNELVDYLTKSDLAEFNNIPLPDYPVGASL